VMSTLLPSNLALTDIQQYKSNQLTKPAISQIK
jgi:hypothetical protein